VSLTYLSYVDQISTLAVVPSTDPYFQIILPEMIEYAELRIQRDLDFLATQVANNTYTISQLSNTFNIPFDDFVTVQTIQFIDLSGDTVNLIPTSKEYIQNIYGFNTFGPPKYFAMYGQTTGQTLGGYSILVGPTPDSTYSLVVTGTQRFPSLSADNSSTYISLYFPDMFIMASMIYITAYQRNFGKVNDDPQMAVTYESQYQTLLKSALTEEYRKKFEGPAWTSRSPSPIATPPRS